MTAWRARLSLVLMLFFVLGTYVAPGAPLLAQPAPALAAPAEATIWRSSSRASTC